MISQNNVRIYVSKFHFIFWIYCICQNMSYEVNSLPTSDAILMCWFETIISGYMFKHDLFHKRITKDTCHYDFVRIWHFIVRIWEYIVPFRSENIDHNLAHLSTFGYICWYSYVILLLGWESLVKIDYFLVRFFVVTSRWHCNVKKTLFKPVQMRCCIRLYACCLRTLKVRVVAADDISGGGGGYYRQLSYFQLQDLEILTLNMCNKISPKWGIT